MDEKNRIIKIHEPRDGIEIVNIVEEMVTVSRGISDMKDQTGINVTEAFIAESNKYVNKYPVVLDRGVNSTWDALARHLTPWKPHADQVQVVLAQTMSEGERLWVQHPGETEWTVGNVKAGRQVDAYFLPYNDGETHWIQIPLYKPCLIFTPNISGCRIEILRTAAAAVLMHVNVRSDMSDGKGDQELLAVLKTFVQSARSDIPGGWERYLLTVIKRLGLALEIKTKFDTNYKRMGTGEEFKTAGRYAENEITALFGPISTTFTRVKMGLIKITQLNASVHPAIPWALSIIERAEMVYKGDDARSNLTLRRQHQFDGAMTSIKPGVDYNRKGIDSEDESPLALHRVTFGVWDGRLLHWYVQGQNAKRDLCLIEHGLSSTIHRIA